MQEKRGKKRGVAWGAYQKHLLSEYAKYKLKTKKKGGKKKKGEKKRIRKKDRK